MPKEKEMSTVEKIYHMLMSQEFDDWFRGDFMDYVEGDQNAKPKDIIFDDISSMLGS